MDKLKVETMLSEIQEKLIKVSQEIITLMDDLNDLDDAVNLKKKKRERGGGKSGGKRKEGREREEERGI